jgi:hypothetical protein
MMPPSIPDFHDCPAANTRGAKFRRTQTFSRLPDEIVENIFLEDVLDESDLYALARVSRRISRLAKVSLYNLVDFTLQDEAYRCFNRTLLEHPELGSYVWTAHLTVDSWEYSEENFEGIQQLLKLMPALRTLVLRHFECSYGPTSLFDISMPHLRDIYFFNNGISSSIHEITKALSFPQIKRLWIESEGSDKQDDDGVEWTRQGTVLNALTGTSSVKDLTLEDWVDSAVLCSALLKIPQALERLTCKLDYSGELTPKRTIEALAPLYSTLVCLDLCYHRYLADLSGPVADFSYFVCLTTLVVQHSLCFELSSAESPDERCGFYNRLPSTLEVLQVSLTDAIIG